MSNALQITRDLWELKMGVVNAYLFRSEDGLVLIDAGWPEKADAIFKAVHDAGQDPNRIRHLVLTNGHIDHAGSAADVIERTGAQSYAHPADLDLIRNGQAEHPGTTVTPGIIPKLIYLAFIKPGGTTYKPFNIDHPLKDGQNLPMAPNIKVLHTPGHSAGHVALLLQNESLLIAGDICSNIMGLGYSILNENRVMARQSILRVTEFSFDRAVLGHGKPLDKRASTLLKERFRKPRFPESQKVGRVCKSPAFRERSDCLVLGHPKAFRARLKVVWECRDS